MNVLAVMAHPDDEVLACGGTLAKHAENGDGVTVLAMCKTRASKHSFAACEVLGADSMFCTYPDQQLDSYAPLSYVVNEILTHPFPDPDVIYTHHPGDLNLDHALTARAVLTAFRPNPGSRPRTILGCEVLSSTEYSYPRTFSPNWYEALSHDQLERKVEAMRAYESELHDFPHPRSVLGIRNLAALRGQEVGVERAECFQLLRRGPT